MAFYVAFLDLGGVSVQVNSDEVFSVTPVPNSLLPGGVPDGTYIADESGARIVVQGTVLATAALLTTGSGASAVAALQVDDQANIQGVATNIASVIRNGPGDYTVSLKPTGLTANPIIVSVTDANAFIPPALTPFIVVADWSGFPDTINVRSFGGAFIPTDIGWSMIVIL